MSIPAEEMSVHVREAILERPDVILSDETVMRALIAANDESIGENVIDFRGIAMDKLSDRLNDLEDTHRSVLANAYENISGTNMIHRAILHLLAATTFEEFIAQFRTNVATTLKVPFIRVVLETAASDDPAIQRLGNGGLAIVPKGYVHEYATGMNQNLLRKVVLRQTKPQERRIYGSDAEHVRSEACLILDLGEGKLPAMVVMGSEDAHQFSPQQGTDLLAFFASVIECAMRRWLD